MKTVKYIYTKSIVLLGMACILLVSCERDLPDEIVFSEFPSTPEIFIDGPVGLGSDFYFPYLGSKATAWSVDNDESYLGSSSMRFDVPNANDPEGNYAGAIFRIDGGGRNLSQYDALTFWAKATQGVTIAQFGFGEDFLENKYVTTLRDVPLSTAWQKIIIPIPDPSKLTQERGMFRYAAGTGGTNGAAFTFWVDELKFEKLGTVAQPRPKMYDGNDVTQTAFIGAIINIIGLTQTFNLANGQDQTVTASPAYFNFSSSDLAVASVNENGEVMVNGEGTAEITASLGSESAQGSLTIQSLGNFNTAPVPTEDPANVISIFSDAYNNVPVDFFNGYWEPFQTTESADFDVNGDNILNYVNFNFVGNQFANPTVDASSKSTLHFDVYVPDGTVSPQLLITLRDFGADGADGGGDDTDQAETFSGASLTPGQWNSLDMSISGMANRNRLGLIIYENLGSGLTSFYLDNIYFY